MNKASGGDGIPVELFKIQRRTWRNKKAFLNEQCKEIEENITMGKTSNLFMKIAYFHAKMGTIKDRINKDLTEAEEIKKKWQEYRKELYRKGLS